MLCVITVACAALLLRSLARQWRRPLAMQAVLHPLSQALLLAPLLSSAPRLGSDSVLGAHHWQQHEWQRHRGLQHGAAPAPAQRAVVRMAGVSGEDSGEELQQGGSLARPRNLYVEQIQNISAPELIKGFAETAPAEVQQAVRSTVVSLLGNLPPHLYDVNVMSTGQNVASLMYSMQMTGYMFRNAEYRRSLINTLDSAERSALTSGDEDPNVLPPVTGKIKVRLSDSLETEVDASAYMAELRTEVSSLRSQLADAKEDALSAQGGGLLSCAH